VDRNELVMRVQPNEAMYLKFNTKVPGLSEETHLTELDLTYKARYQDLRLPDAYERLIYDVLRGDHNLFVRSDELEAAWKIFTPLLHHIEGKKVKPIEYTFGSRGPVESDDLMSKYGYQRSKNYKWEGKSKI
jgi:glucose-6-phosphate 1-dehydrogenase